MLLIHRASQLMAAMVTQIKTFTPTVLVTVDLISSFILGNLAAGQEYEFIRALITLYLLLTSN